MNHKVKVKLVKWMTLLTIQKYNKKRNSLSIIMFLLIMCFNLNKLLMDSNLLNKIYNKRIHLKC
jgi:hypothetical protein